MKINACLSMRGLVPTPGVLFTPSCSRLSH
jgi:hypothetical protein